jgi:hypothetical protein
VWEERRGKARDNSEICLYHRRFSNKKPIESCIAQNKIHEFYARFTGLRFGELENTFSTITIVKRTHVGRNISDHKGLRNYLIYFVCITYL